MKNIVFFFVNPDQIIDLSRNTVRKNQLPTLDEYKVITSKNGLQTFNLEFNNDLDLTVQSNEILIVVEDVCNTKSIRKRIKEYSSSDEVRVYSVFHQTPGNAGTLSSIFLSELGLSFRSSITEHEVTGSAYDNYLIPLIKNFNAGLFNELLSKFPDPVLEQKLILLHDCLVPSGIPKELSPILKNAPNGNDYNAAYTAFLKACEGKTDTNIFDSDFIDALTKLRIALLGS